MPMNSTSNVPQGINMQNRSRKSGIVNIVSRDKKRYKIVHNIGAGQVLEDCLFDYKIIGHYRFLKKK